MLKISIRVGSFFRKMEIPGSKVAEPRGQYQIL